jgi:transcription-repair coupling factor (superfamily II helicase)
MFDKLKRILLQTPAFADFKLPAAGDHDIHVSGLKGSLPAVFLTFLLEKYGRSVLYLAADTDSAECLRDDLELLLGTAPMIPQAPPPQVSFFPAAEIIPYEEHEPNPSLVRLRWETLHNLISAKNIIVVATLKGMLQKVPDTTLFLDHCLQLSKNQTVNFDKLIQQLLQGGYERVEFVESVGHFSVRGGIVDLYPWTQDDAVRLEFFGNTIESLRTFNVITQRSIAEIEHIEVVPNLAADARGCSLMEYLQVDAIVVYEDLELIRAQARDFFVEAQSRYQDHKVHVQQADTPEQRYLVWAELEKKLSALPAICLDLLSRRDMPAWIFESMVPPSFAGHLNRLFAYLRKTYLEKQPVYIQCESNAQAERLKEILVEEELERTAIVVSGSFHYGFIFPAAGIQVLTDHEIFGRFKRRRTYRRFKNGEYLRSLNSLNLNDYVVHIDYGIGQYTGVDMLETGKTRRECLRIRYAGDDVLYVSVDRLNRVQKYSGEEGAAPQLTKLGSGEWERVKIRTRESVEKIAADLIQLQATRRTMPAFAYNTDTHWQKELEATFPFDETEDQLRAIIEVKRDLESDSPMDRLLCGDVGYGKTEVALRSAFKVNMDGKQVAILVPTTILAYQHFQTFKERMNDFPVHIEMLSRFRSLREQRQILIRLAAGEIDIIIGTHRLLSADVKFKDLGLLIIDEEQRFGVRHKEHLKKLRASVDILTMTATPIPRTLHLSLMGARDLSHIETPPRNRLPVITELLEWDDPQIQQAIRREIQRKGQVYFVHNRVETIVGICALLQQIVPEARLVIAHGQLSEKKLEQVMLDFINKKYDVLVSTMIIENGLDIPNVNTLIINRADKFGLAQLYQLRGRVGRSAEQAYAYLLIPPVAQLTTLARKRLKAIQDFTELGSGFRLALRDLEIRGIGNILGKEQSGNIQAVGFDLYCRILDNAVRKIKAAASEVQMAVFAERGSDPKLDVDFDLVIPADYISSEQERIALYHKMVNFHSGSELEKISSELADRFGPVPEAVQNLIQAIRMKILASEMYASQLVWKKNMLLMSFSESQDGDADFMHRIVTNLIQGKKSGVRFIKQKQGLGIQLQLAGETKAEQVDSARNILKDLI